MTKHRRTKKAALLLGTAACLTLLSVSGPTAAFAAERSASEQVISDPVRVYGTISREGDRILLNQVQGDTSLDMLVLNISEETKILDALNGYPVSADTLQNGESVYAYISQAMALSLPPQSHAEMIICQIPADFAVPSYETTASLSGSEDAGWQLTTRRGMIYGIDEETTLLPYLTRNIVTAENLVNGVTCLVWPDRNMMTADGKEIIHASKVVIFPSAEGSYNSGMKKVSGPASDLALH